MCGTSFFASEITESDGGWFRCPFCGEWLEYDSKYSMFLWLIAGILATVLSWRLGYRSGQLAVLAMVVTILLGLAGIFLREFLVPSGYSQAKAKWWSLGVYTHHTELRLTDKSDLAKKKGRISAQSGSNT